ncbi:43012_t:CDS:1, partial [Gigaspora margarita]
LSLSHKNFEIYYDDKKGEYIPVLISCQHFLDKPESDNEDKQEEEENTSDVRKKIYKQKAAPKLLLPPTNFELLVHQ